MTGLALVAPVENLSAQSLTFAPTYQQSLVTYESRVAEPFRGEQHFYAWGVMLGLERPGRFWQPHLWYQRYDFGNACQLPNDVVDCGNVGWALSIGPGLQVLETPDLSGTILATVGVQTRGGAGFTGGVGFHLGVKLGVLQPSAFAGYQMIRGVHYGTVGAGLVMEFPFGRDRGVLTTPLPLRAERSFPRPGDRTRRPSPRDRGSRSS